MTWSKQIVMGSTLTLYPVSLYRDDDSDVMGLRLLHDMYRIDLTFKDAKELADAILAEYFHVNDRRK
jgi:hypothetical protein